MSLLIIFLIDILFLTKNIESIQYNVTTFTELSQAIKKVNAGVSIILTDGLYVTEGIK
jgi:hypothetical protein